MRTIMNKSMSVVMIVVVTTMAGGMIGCNDAQIDKALLLAERYLNESGDTSVLPPSSSSTSYVDEPCFPDDYGDWECWDSYCMY